ncbi:MAG: hypothetical protein LBH57_05920 [Treponema sp.]|jgi:hypothetical protein|nr:hypothetical protein [Treponema sp.]
MKKFLFIGLSALLLSCAAPMTKETYMVKYKDFIDDVYLNNEGFTESEWEKMDGKFDELSGLSERFSEELTWQDRIILAKYQIQYFFCRNKNTAGRYAGEIFNDVRQLEQRLRFYVEHDMEDDILFLLEQAKEIGGGAVTMIKDILRELGYNADP